MKALLSIPMFRRFTGAWTIGNLADSALFLTLSIWVKDISGSSSAAGLVFLALGLPIVFSPLIGALADRLPRRRLLILGNAVSGAGALLLLLVTGPGDLWLIYAVAFIYGLLGILNGAAQSGLVRDMLSDEHLDSANGLLSTIDQGLRIFTPLLGAALYTLWGGSALALSVAGALALTAVLLLTVSVQESAPEPASERGGFWHEHSAGFRHLNGVPLLWRMVLVTAVALGVIGLFDSALFELIDKGLGREPGFFGVLMSLQGAGSILGGLTAAILLRRVGPGRAVGLGLALIGLAAFGATADLVPFVARHELLTAVVIPALFLAGVGIPWIFVALVTTRQRLTPARLQGRAAAATNLVLNVPQLASIAAGALLVSVVDYRWLMLIAGLVIAGCAWSMLRSRREPEPAAEEPAAVDGAM
ncbi:MULTISPECIES: MFS transporter [Paeniglutamicibacter]|uniref:MFS family permease n=1 Tax=Paeniglutamicibacter sulfureus TaxID=43666 RepID=A0ABU2BDJ3_9MICC|nr:MFS transporter [Paeniglutamicibacter sulfureus]MDR7356693.1 MFS family permease [Paeniglutamicibacter sulfureus]